MKKNSLCLTNERGRYTLNTITSILVISQLAFTIIAGLYFYENLKNQSANRSSIKIDSTKETERIKKLRSIKLTEPLAEKSRPSNLKEVIGQEQGVKALRAALCSANPQHVIIYGPPGVGKTAAARLILEEAKKHKISPFQDTAKFVEIDATTLRFDERSIADPLIGSVHDPIYQGAGAFGPAGVPQPKEGAVTRAHGGVLFIDEIGELHSIQMNKLLKVLEDRTVYFTSSYYNSESPSIPQYIHDIFKNGLPADFRLVGATTRSPEEIPPALRSRCTEIYFDELKPSHIREIGKNALIKAGCLCENGVVEKLTMYASNGRDAVNIIQTAASVAFMNDRNKILLEDIEWVLETGRYAPKLSKRVSGKDMIGVVNGLAVYGGGKGALLEIEAMTEKAETKGSGILKVTGIVEEEEIKSNTGAMRRKSNARSSVENVMTAMEKILNLSMKDYHIHINFPGGAPVDGPSAGIAIFCAVYSSLTKKTIASTTAMTGEISIQGKVLPVGGVTNKIMAAMEAGAKKVLIPEENWQSAYDDMKVEVIKVKKIGEVIQEMFGEKEESKVELNKNERTDSRTILTAQGLE